MYLCVCVWCICVPLRRRCGVHLCASFCVSCVYEMYTYVRVLYVRKVADVREACGLAHCVYRWASNVNLCDVTISRRQVS